MDQMTILWSDVSGQSHHRNAFKATRSTQFFPQATRSQLLRCWHPAIMRSDAVAQAILKSTPTKAKRKELALLPDNYGSMASAQDAVEDAGVRKPQRWQLVPAKLGYLG